MTGITIQGLNKSYDGQHVVSDLDLQVKEGEFLTLLGPSGCGKTTTLRCVAGLEEADSGTISIGDNVVFDAARSIMQPPEQRRLGMVFQSYALWPHMTVYGNIAYPLKMRHVPRKEIRPRVEEVLRLVDLKQMMSRPVGNMSGGQQQRVALARALVASPQALLFDEPLSNLDAALRATMRSELQNLHHEVPTTSLYVTHDQTEALTLSDRIAVMRAGRIQQIGSPTQIYTRPVNEFVARFVGFENFLPGTVINSTKDSATVQISGVEWEFTCPADDIDTGEEVTLAARPNAVTIGASGSIPDGMPAQLVSQTYLGEQIECRFRLGELSITARISATAPVVGVLEVGGRVDLSIPGNAIHLLPGPTALVSTTAA